MDRRHFIQKSFQATTIAGFGMANSNIMAKSNANNQVTATIPRPIQIVIDDVGWWSGTDGSKYQEPYRTGINRNHIAADYQAIVELGKALNMRPQAAFVLGEWDRKNILKVVPHSTWMGNSWDNSKWVGPWLEEAADIINQNKEYFEITMHGLGHEWWTDGVFTRAEWADKEGVMRPAEDLKKHIEAFAEIMTQNNLGEMPTSFVPTAFNHGFGITPGNNISFAELLKQYGFTYINTPFYNMLNKEDAQHELFGVDSGLITVDRGPDLLNWDVISTKPAGEITGTTSGMHWPNMLHENPDRNMEIVEAWVKLLSPYNKGADTMLSRNSYEFQQQIVHHQCTEVNVNNQSIELDFTETNKVDSLVQTDEFTVKASSNKELRFSSDHVKINSVDVTKNSGSLLFNINIHRGSAKRARIDFS